MYWQAITQIEAQQMLLASEVSAFPHMTEQARERLHRRWHEQAYPDVHSGETISLEELAARLKGVVRG